MNEIITNLYVSGYKVESSITFDLIINCTNNIPDILNAKSRIRLLLNDTKNDNDKMYDYLMYIPDEIHKILKNGGKVLVHCQVGASRSPTIIAGYLLKYGGSKVSLGTVINYIQSKRDVAFFCNNVVFKDALIRLQYNVTKFG